MASWSGKTKGGKRGYKFFILLVKNTHIRVTYFFVFFVALYYSLFAKKEPLKFYFYKIVGFSKSKTRISILKNYFLLGQSLVDKFSVLSGIRDRFSFDFLGESFLHDIVKGGKGGLLIGAHMGNWEVAGELLERLDTKINLVMYDAEKEEIKKVLEESLNRNDMHIIAIKEDFSHLFKIKEAFDRNEMVVMHGDRFLPGTNTIKVDFMGKPALFPTGPLYLASKHKVPVSYVYALKESASHYSFYATEGKIYPYPSKIKTRQEEIKKMILDYVKSFESIINKYPLQWFNYYPFWEEEKKN